MDTHTHIHTHTHTHMHAHRTTTSTLATRMRTEAFLIDSPHACVGVDGPLPLPAMEDDTQLMDTCSPSTPPARPNTRGYLKVFPQGHLTMERNYLVTEGVCVGVGVGVGGGGGGGGGGWGVGVGVGVGGWVGVRTCHGLTTKCWSHFHV